MMQFSAVSDPHHFGDVPDADLAPFSGSSQKLRAAAEAIAGDLVRTVVTVGTVGGAGGQCHRQRHVLRVLALHKRTIGRMPLVFGPADSGEVLVINGTLSSID